MQQVRKVSKALLARRVLLEKRDLRVLLARQVLTQQSQDLQARKASRERLVQQELQDQRVQTLQ